MGGGKGDLRRVVDGVALILAEALRRSTTFIPPHSSSFPPADLIRKTLKSALVSATDLAGITSGKIVPHSAPPLFSFTSTTGTYDINTDASRSQSSVVHFSDDDVSEGGTEVEKVSTSSTTGVEVEDIPKIIGEDVKEERDSPPSHVPHSQSDDTDITGVQDGAQKQTVPISSSSKTNNVTRRRPRERRVPSTPFGRAIGFAGLGAGLAWGTLQESTRRILYGMPPQSTGRQSAISPLLSDQNAERLALALCRMRGAALKLGQMLSIQDESLVPASVLAALDIVRQGADVMPRSQLNDVLDTELGQDWRKKLKSFDYEPLAAASIGQVHRAVMKDGLEVAMKIQYPGVADSIDSDIENVRRLLSYTNLIPKGLFLDRAIKVAKEELSQECDYELESRNQKRFRDLLFDSEGVYVPAVIDVVSSKKVLTTELVSGTPIDKVASLSQDVRNHVGKKLLELTLKELFIFRFMQTDPNWSNFLYEESTNMINLIDFGAAREYRKSFVDDYLRMVLACANRDRDSIIEMSTRLGFLTGMESEVMLDAHVQASFIVGLPFSTSGAYDFRASNITGSIAHLGATMLKHRLTPPPDEAYSLHRKLSGAFLACIKLGVVVPCRDLLLQVYQQYHFSDDNEESTAASSVS